ncbi:hydrogenase maturation nickel metallochaperone HypA/HybF [Desulfovibrio cuneatus]|uniref:hydrogenase maturation nickel metallochaperone HypA/HybF n=1 Tax=Desulfovibrio cuneatus TaxID=159728 RepID=UPI0004228AB8|nr:hydrogenase maturation nickel metallochaperone HypA [Desulfovibrio cuneatus]
MHETVFASSLLRIVLEEAKRHETQGAALQVKHVRLRAGLLACVEAHTLTGCFSLLAEGTPAEGATLEVVVEPLTGHCPACKASVSTTSRRFSCPQCGGEGVRWAEGNQLYIDTIKVAPYGTAVQAVT